MRFLVFFFILIHFLSCGNKNSETLIKSKTGSIYKLAGTINGYSNRPFFIYGFYGFESFPVDSGITGDKGELKWTIPPDWNPGLYRLVFESFNQNQIETGEKHLDFIIKRENIEFSTYYQYLVDSLKITESNENKGFYEFLKKRDLYKLKVNVLTRTLFSYPAKDKFYSQISRQLNRLKKRFSNFTENLISKNKNLLFTRIVQINKIPDIPDNLPGNLADKYSRDKHLLYTNFADTFLLRTPFIAEKILTYLTLYRNDALSESDQAEAYKNAVDNIMLKASVNEDFFYKIAEYLINGFESLNMLAVSENISSQYILGSVCNRDNIPASLRERAENLKKLAVGMPSPDFDFVTSEGQALSLYKIDSQYTVLVFWTSTCPFCLNLLSGLQLIVENFRVENPGFVEVLAVSIEKNKDQWKAFIGNQNFEFIHTFVPSGWDSKTAKLYNINATPMLFLIDNKKNIVLKPNRVQTLEKYLAENINRKF